MATDTTTENGPSSSQEAQTHVNATTEYCAKMQEWMWQYYWGYANWQSCMTDYVSFFSMQFPRSYKLSSLVHATPSPLQIWSTPPLLPCRSGVHHPFSPADLEYTTPSPLQVWSTPPLLPCRSGVHHPFSPAGLEYTTPSPHHRFLAETVDFFILFCVKATIILWIMHLFLVLGCFCEIFWGLGGATPGKILLGLQVVTCDSSVLVRPNRVLVVPGSDVTLSASNFSIAFLFSIFTTFFFQHNRTVYDIVAGTIVVQHRGVR
uniref:RDD domain-containing protein n=1 Tax=Oncorhynchus tshawytscha TaxID=74940 RepID=A0AAZ3RJN9_ONCTS